MTPQATKLLTTLRAGRSVTRLTAMHMGIMNLTARVADLRNAGHEVACVWKSDDVNGTKYGSFTLV